MAQKLSEEQKRKAAEIWYEKYGRQREPRMPASRQRLVQFALLGAALLMIVVGLQLRSDKMDRMMGRDQIDSDEWVQRLSREMELDKESARLFFPMWETWLRKEKELLQRREGITERLEELSRGRSNLNHQQVVLLKDLRGVDSLLFAEPQKLLDDVRLELGLWRAARLGALMYEFKQTVQD